MAGKTERHACQHTLRGEARHPGGVVLTHPHAVKVVSVRPSVSGSGKTQHEYINDANSNIS